MRKDQVTSYRFFVLTFTCGPRAAIGAAYGTGTELTGSQSIAKVALGTEVGTVLVVADGTYWAHKG